MSFYQSQIRKIINMFNSVEDMILLVECSDGKMYTSKDLINRSGTLHECSMDSDIPYVKVPFTKKQMASFGRLFNTVDNPFKSAKELYEAATVADYLNIKINDPEEYFEKLYDFAENKYCNFSEHVNEYLEQLYVTGQNKNDMNISKKEEAKEDKKTNNDNEEEKKKRDELVKKFENYKYTWKYCIEFYEELIEIFGDFPFDDKAVKEFDKNTKVKMENKYDQMEAFGYDVRKMIELFDDLED